MIQATRYNAAHRIAKNGFGTISSLDPGFYGTGIYFTSTPDYARYYNDKFYHESTFLISLVLPGTAFPVIEHHLTDEICGKPLRPGYQSHYVIVDKIGSVFDKDPFKPPPNSNDELVVFEGCQVLPIFLIFSKKPALRKGWQRQIPDDPEIDEEEQQGQ